MMFDLPLRKATLHVEVADLRWSTWTLIAGGRATRLGAENLDTIAPRILEHLTKPHESMGSIDDRSVQWVCSFAENHHTIYCAWSESTRDIFFQDPAARVIWRDSLTPGDLERWSAVLHAG